MDKNEKIRKAMDKCLYESNKDNKFTAYDEINKQENESILNELRSRLVYESKISEMRVEQINVLAKYISFISSILVLAITFASGFLENIVQSNIPDFFQNGFNLIILIFVVSTFGFVYILMSTNKAQQKYAWFNSLVEYIDKK